MIRFVTNRDPIFEGDRIVGFGPRFNAYPDELRFGVVHAGVLDVWPDPGSQKFMEAMREEMAGGMDALGYIHGYGTSWEASVEGAVELSGLFPEYSVVLFSWPSDGAHWYKSYQRDRLDAQSSGLALARMIVKLSDWMGGLKREEFCGHRIHLLCHSMGNYVLECAVRELARRGTMPAVFGEILLCAPDVDVDALNNDGKLGRLPEIADRVTVFYNRGDLALRMSDLTKGNPQRLGTVGPEYPNALRRDVRAIDCTAWANPGDHACHLYGETLLCIRKALTGS